MLFFFVGVTSLVLLAQAQPRQVVFPTNAEQSVQDHSSDENLEHSFAGDECNPTGGGKVYRISPQAIRYCGLIDLDGIAALERLLDADVTDLVITSAGGAKEAPVNLARIVQKLGMNVEVAGPCFSGCAAFVFIAAKNRTLSSTALLGLHQTASSSSLMLSRQTNGNPSGASLNLLHRSQLEGVLYASTGIDFDLLYVPQVLIETICVIPAEFEASAGESIIQIVSDFDVWVPTGDSLRQFGVTHYGELPKNHEEAIDRFRTYMSDQAKLPEFAIGEWPSERSPYRSLFEVEVCPTDLVDAISER